MNRSVKLTLAGLTIAAIAWLAFGFFGIQAAFIDNEVSEANPFATVTSTTIADVAVEGESASGLAGAIPADAGLGSEPVEQTPEPPVEIVTLATGSLVDHAHSGVGTINVITDGDQRFLRFEDDFAVDNGPDLNVYLVRGADAEGDPGLFDDDFIDLGDLKGNIGAQNYELDADIDLSEYDTVVIWCVRFGVAFNAANLS